MNTSELHVMDSKNETITTITTITRPGEKLIRRADGRNGQIYTAEQGGVYWEDDAEKWFAEVRVGDFMVLVAFATYISDAVSHFNAAAKHLFGDKAKLICHRTGSMPVSDELSMMADFDEAVAIAKERSRAAKPSKPKGPGLVYFIRAESGGPIKIGWTHDIDRRLSTLNTSSPYRLEVLATMQCRKDVELRLHERFKASRLNGEWFEPTADLLGYIAGIGGGAK